MRRFLRLPNRIPVRLPDRQTSQKWLVAFVIAAAATVAAVGWRHTVLISAPMQALDEFLYDQVYRLREHEDRAGGNVVIVAIDMESLRRLEDRMLNDAEVYWPWPRELYGDMVQYLERCGARVVALDVLFDAKGRQSEQLSDEAFAEALAESKLPVVFATQVSDDGKPGRFALPVKDPVFGAANTKGLTLRDYRPFVNGYPSLAYRAATIYRNGDEPAQRASFRVHFYGPRVRADGRTTFPYVEAFKVIAAANGAEAEAKIDPAMFRDKIVLVGGTAQGLYDAKVTPLDDVYPGVEWQATALENLLNGDRVVPVPLPLRVLVTFGGCLAATAGVLLSRRTTAKIAALTLAAAAVVGLGVFLFRGQTIRWLPLAAPVTALLLSSLAALAWSYFTEGRARQFFSNAFALATSPDVVAAIDRDPRRIKLGGERRDITVMFTDLAGFTDLSETMEVVKLAQVINTYMEAMSDEIVRRDGYLDKYIGDAIMSFWNGLVDQPDHAARACRAALGIKRRELEIAPDLQKLVAARIVTRIGINTGPMAVGNLGSSRKLSYTVLGDAVNLGARLEPANKLYDTEVMISQTVAERVRGQFAMRELDLLAVKGKTIPMAVYELMDEGPPIGDTLRRIEMYAAALGHYRAQRWDEAEAAFRAVLAAFPADGPSGKMLQRIPALREAGLPADWDGVYRAKEK